MFLNVTHLIFFIKLQECKYSKALRCTFFWERKNSCSSKFVQLLLLNRVKAVWLKNRAAQGFTTQIRLSQIFLDPIQKRAPARSVQLKAVYLEALLYLTFTDFQWVRKHDILVSERFKWFLKFEMLLCEDFFLHAHCTHFGFVRCTHYLAPNFWAHTRTHAHTLKKNMLNREKCKCGRADVRAHIYT